MNEIGKIKPDALKRLLLGKLCIIDAKRLFTFSKDRLSIARAALLYHDAAESIFGAIAQHTGIHIKDKDSLLGILNTLNKNKKSIANSSEIQQLNSIRVQIKHKGIFPDRSTYGDTFAAVESSLHRACKEYLEIDLSDVSLKDSINDEEIRTLVESAEGHANEENFEEALKDAARCMYRIAESGDVFVQKLFRTRSDNKSEAEEPILPRIWSIENLVRSIEHGIDIGAYRTFKQITPQIGIGIDGESEEVLWGHDFGHEKNWNYHNVRYCIDFCIESAIKFQEHREHGLSLVHYYEAYVDIVTARRDGVEVWNGPKELVKFVPDNVVKVVAHLEAGEQIEGCILPRETSVKLDLGSNEIVMSAHNFEAQDLWYEGMIVLSKNDVEVSRRER